MNNKRTKAQDYQQDKIKYINEIATPTCFDEKVTEGES